MFPSSVFTGLVLIWLAFVNCDLAQSMVAISLAVGLCAFNVPGSLVSGACMIPSPSKLYERRCSMSNLAGNDRPGAQLHGHPRLVPEHDRQLHRFHLSPGHLSHLGMICPIIFSSICVQKHKIGLLKMRHCIESNPLSGR